ncbi:MAG: hypothetical protein M3N98_03570 [Actinomycetota bacterium]|nr:hypothetical protein [Actinomycetota bacterium]
MNRRRLPRGLGRMAVLGIASIALVVQAASPAAADTSTAFANAATLQLNGGTLLTSGACTSTNSGPPVTAQTCGQTPNLSVLGTQTAVTAGVLTQQTVANPDGTSAACAGLVGTGATIQIGTGGVCTILNAPPQGVTINLGAIAVIKADAILGQCTASSTAAGVASVQLVNATISILGGTATPIMTPIPKNDVLLNLGPLINATLNEQPPAPPAPQPLATGQVGTTALDLTVLSGLPGAAPLVRLTVGTVTCGPNAVTVVSPVIPLKGAPIAVAMALLAGYVGWRFWWIPRRRRDAISA